jgi:hypothetical protein
MVYRDRSSWTKTRHQAGMPWLRRLCPHNADVINIEPPNVAFRTRLRRAVDTPDAARDWDRAEFQAPRALASCLQRHSSGPTLSIPE